MAKKIIKLYDEFSDNIFTRKTVSSFFDRINKLKEKEIIIDFKNIEFISRSCADEYLKLKKETKKIIIERNLSNEIKSMFRLVENQLRKIHFSFTPKNPSNGILCPA